MRDDPLLTDRAPGVLGRAIVRIPLFLFGVIVSLLMLPWGLWKLGLDYPGAAAGALVEDFVEDIWPPRPVVILSPRAQQLYQRLLNGDFYAAYDPKTPKAMQELVAAGLVGIGGRVMKVGAFYVPMGTVPYRMEKIRP